MFHTSRFVSIRPNLRVSSTQGSAAILLSRKILIFYLSLEITVVLQGLEFFFDLLKVSVKERAFRELDEKLFMTSELFLLRGTPSGPTAHLDQFR